jgi:N utilization substance protein B
VAQLAIVDRNILRIAVFEIVLNKSVPFKAAINEAVELAKIFGSDNSSKFINGVLGSVSAQSSGKRR